MHELIVLGLVPGTHIQITFFLWIVLVVSVVAGVLIWAGHRTHLFRNWIIAITFAVLIRRQMPA
jgi:hypothetical protein